MRILGFSKWILPANRSYEKGQRAILQPRSALWRKKSIHHSGLSRILAGPIFPPQFPSLGVERNMAACCLYHLNWYKSQPLLDQDEMRPENRLWPHERWVYGSQECFRTDRYDTGLYSDTVNISHRHTKYWFVPCKCLPQQTLKTVTFVTDIDGENNSKQSWTNQTLLKML